MCTRNALTIRTAERAGDPSRSTEDRIFTTDQAVILLDGATSYERQSHTGGWIADQVGRRLQYALVEDPAVDLRKTIKSTIHDVVSEFGLVPGSAPSTTLAILRINKDNVEALVIADSPIIIKRRSGGLIEVRDDRLAEISAKYPRPPGRPPRNDRRVVQRHQSIECHRNQPGGFWAVSASPAAAEEARTLNLPLHEVDAALLMTDGVSVLGDCYDPRGWAPNFDLYVAAPQKAIDQTLELEAEDPDCKRWPRSKLHDDKAIASVTIQR